MLLLSTEVGIVPTTDELIVAVLEPETVGFVSFECVTEAVKSNVVVVCARVVALNSHTLATESNFIFLENNKKSYNNLLACIRTFLDMSLQLVSGSFFP